MKQAAILTLLVAGIALTGWSSVALERIAEERAVAAPSAAAAEMAHAAERFLASLSGEQRAVATFPFEDSERTRWHFVPTEMHARQGLVIGEMNEGQRALAHALLASGLSEGGYTTATAVMELEAILREIEAGRGRFERDPLRYFLTIFGDPTEDGTWAWRIEGHHLSLHFTVVDGAWVATAPAFFGANPAEVREGPRQGLRILADREDLGRELLHSLDEAQRSVALISEDAPNDILTMADLEIEPLEPVGIAAAELRPDQRELLMSLIETYALIATEEVAEARLAAIREAGIDPITFAWAGGTERGDRHYYRIQGPSFLIEYDNTQNDANHIHSVWRDFDGDFGRDLLREHLSAVAH